MNILIVNCYNKMATTMFNITAAEFLLLNALHRENKLTVHPLHAEPVPVLAF